MSTKRLEQLKALLEESPHDSFLSFAIAKEYEKTGDREKALRYYLYLEEHDPEYVGAYYHLGKLYEQMGEEALALETYDKGIAAARRAGDQHALGELAAAKLALE
ncbi:MAG: tetratricopeptide repeat protein [Phaeodactylibacter sp.]|nr:tetratricopeptide repeat protein [Phaeodactylibacter sp.]MCB9287219.1 tetratricopeptide repeat protein [Lewinellaceae bacterium]